jgi:hypothetical protein
MKRWQLEGDIDMNIHEIGETPPENGLPESSGINPRPILVFLGVLAASTLIIFLIIYGMLWGFNRMDEANQQQPATFVTTGQKLPPEPRLQGAPGPNNVRSKLPMDDLKAYREDMEKKANSYGYVDKGAGITRIPLEEAKKLVVKQGYPVLKGPYADELKKAETVRREVLNSESNAGRIIK